jgi:hypothetical protein
MKETENDRGMTMPPIGQNGSSQEQSAYLVKNSRFMKAKERDSRLFRSPRYDDYLVLKQEVDLIEKLEGQYILIEIFDELANESSRVRELTTLLIWKEDELREKTKELRYCQKLCFSH